MKRYLYCCVGSLHILIKNNDVVEISCKDVSLLCNRAYSIITNIHDLTKKKQKNARVKQVLNDNGYQKALLVKSLR